MLDPTSAPIKTSRTRSLVTLALAMLAGGALACAWSVAQNVTGNANTMSATAPTGTSLPATPAPAPAPSTIPSTLPATPPATSAPTKAALAKPPRKMAESRLAWANLSVPQQQALEPLAGEWGKMSDLQKEKWLVIGKKYAQMKPEEQQRLHDRMRDWVKLTPAQRSAARTNYARAKKLDAEEKTEQWHKYQQLSVEQRKKLAQAKPPKRVAKLPTSPGAGAPSIQLPPEALERPTPALVPAIPQAPATSTSPASPASPTVPALAPGSQAAPQPAVMPVPTIAPVQAAVAMPVATTVSASDGDVTR